MQKRITLDWLNLIRKLSRKGESSGVILRELLYYGYAEENRINKGFGNEFIEIDDFIDSFDTELEHYEPNTKI